MADLKEIKMQIDRLFAIARRNSDNPLVLSNLEKELQKLRRKLEIGDPRGGPNDSNRKRKSQKTPNKSNVHG